MATVKRLKAKVKVMVLLDPRKKTLRMRRLEEALLQEYEDRATYKCPMCDKPFLGGYMHDHLSMVHARGGAFRRALDPAALKVVRSARPIVGAKVVKRTPERAESDRRNLCKPSLPDAHVPGSNLRKIDK